VKLVPVGGNSATKELQLGGACKRGGASDEEDWDPQVNYMSAVDMVEMPTSTTTDVVKVLALTSVVQDFYNEANVVATGGVAKVYYKNDWIVDSGYSNHMTGEEDKFKSIRLYNGNRVVVTADNTQHPVKHIGDAKIAVRYGDNGILHGVYHVPGMAKNLLSVPQITTTRHYVLFGPKDMKIF
jgi:hypothetical protein